ncbi:MAG: hypothetical protein ACOCVU_06015, partial [Desulfohalobiaceae bacterium]
MSMERLFRKATGVVLLGVVLAALPVCLWAYGGGGGGGAGSGGGADGGGGENSFGGSPGGPPDLWEIDPDLENLADGEVAEGTLELSTPLEDKISAELENVFEDLGGEDGTGLTYEEWIRTERAGRAAVQVILQEDLAEAFDEAEWAHRKVIALDKVDKFGEDVQVVISFVPIVGTGASVGLDAGRAFANAYKKAMEEGKSWEEAVEIAAIHASTKGVTTAITAGSLGNLAGKTWSKAGKIPFNPNKMQSIAKKGANILTTAGLKITEFGVNAGADELRHQAQKNSPTNQAPAPSHSS